MKADHGAQLKYINTIQLNKMKAVMGPLLHVSIKH